MNSKYALNEEKEDFEETYGGFLKSYGRKVKEIIDRWPKGLRNEISQCEKLVGELSAYFSSIKKEVTKAIKKINSSKTGELSQLSQKSESTKFRESSSFLRLLKEEASTKMTEEDRKFFLRDDQKSKKKEKMSKGKVIEGNYYDLTIDGIELPRVRQRSNSLHLGKRRFEQLPPVDLDFEVERRKELKVKDDKDRKSVV